MNALRLLFQYALGAIARRLHFNDKLNQFCDRCGRTNYLGFWADNDVWEKVAGNVNGHRHGAYCVSCFHSLAQNKNIRVEWIPTIQ